MSGLVYKSYNSRSLLWAYTVSERGRPINETSQTYDPFDEKQRAEGAAASRRHRQQLVSSEKVKKRKKEVVLYSYPKIDFTVFNIKLSEFRIMITSKVSNLLYTSKQLHTTQQLSITGNAYCISGGYTIQQYTVYESISEI